MRGRCGLRCHCKHLQVGIGGRARRLGLDSPPHRGLDAREREVCVVDLRMSMQAMSSCPPLLYGGAMILSPRYALPLCQARDLCPSCTI